MNPTTEEYEGRKGSSFASHDDPVQLARFRDLVNKLRERHPNADKEMLLDMIDPHVVNDEGMRRAVIKVSLVNAFNYGKPHATEVPPRAASSTAAAAGEESISVSARPYKPRKKPTEQQQNEKKALVNLAHWKLSQSYLMLDGKPVNDHTSGEALDHSAVCHDELQKIVARFGRDVVLNTLSDDDILAALRSQ